MVLKTIKIFFVVLLLVSCNVPYATFRYDNKEIYILSQDNKLIITTTPKSQRSTNHLLIVDDGDRFDKLLIYVNLCDTSYHVIVRGGIEVVGKPDFTYEEIGWYFDERQKRLEREYSMSSDCKFRYYE